MDEGTLPDRARPHMPQTTAALLEEIASLRKQNEDQRHELEHLRAAVLSPLRQSNSSVVQPVQPTTMHRFNDFPFEIRQMIWGHALPKQILGNHGIVQSHLVPKHIYVPVVGHVCRESRRFAKSKNHNKALPGEDAGLTGDTEPPSRARFGFPTPASWAWFSPCTDALMINTESSSVESNDANHFLARAAEHIIVEDVNLWQGYYEESQGLLDSGMYDQGVDFILAEQTNWVRKVYATPYSESEHDARTHAPICSLRTVDFVMRPVVTQIHRDSPPQFLRRLFGDATFRVVDLRDMDKFLRALGHELSLGMDQDLFFECSSELANALDIYKSVADKYFQHLRPFLLKALVSACFEASQKESSEGQASLPTPFKPGGSKLNMEVPWVKELNERLTVRPVHVFVIGEDMSEP